MSDGAASTGSNLQAGQAAQVLEQLAVERVGDGHHQHGAAALQRQHRVPAGEGAGEGPGDEAGVELDGVDLPVGHPHRGGHHLGGLVLVDQLGLAPQVGELEAGQQLDGRQLGVAQPPAPAPRGLLAQQAGPLHVLARGGGLAGVLGEQPLAGQRLGDELQREVGGVVAARQGAPSLPRGHRATKKAPARPGPACRAARPGGAQIPQPMGPQSVGGPPPAEPPPPRVAAGRDMRLVTLREPQAGQATSASSDLRRIRVSKSGWPFGQEYS